MPLNNSYDEQAVIQAIASALETFYGTLIEKIDGLNIQKVMKRKNPYLYRAKAMQSATEIVDSVLTAFVSSSEETIFGNCFFEPIAIAASGGNKALAEGIDTVVNDLIGVRVLYLYQDQFQLIHNELLKKVDETKDWMFVEAPKAYTWDPETREYFEKLNIHTEVRDTYYTSVHYVIKPNNELSNITCEIQVRTLFEEIWGEIDHTINYPHPTEIIACKEQLRVLAKLVSTGTRLADSIFRTYNDVSEK